MLFYIPKIPGGSLISLSVKSINSLTQWRSQMMNVEFNRGAISGLNKKGQPIFWVTKRWEQINRTDPNTGEATKVWQWITKLEADLPMDEILSTPETGLKLTDAAKTAALSLQTPQCDVVTAVETTINKENGTESPPIEPHEDVRFETKAARASLASALENVGIEHKKFGIYATGKWGEDWSHTLNTLKVAETEVTEAAATDIDGYIDQVYNPAPF